MLCSLFYNDTAAIEIDTDIHTLSLHVARPVGWSRDRRRAVSDVMAALRDRQPLVTGLRVTGSERAAGRAPPVDQKEKIDAIPSRGAARRLVPACGLLGPGPDRRQASRRKSTRLNSRH